MVSAKHTVFTASNSDTAPAALNAALTLLTVNFADLLTCLLTRSGYTRAELYEYIFARGYEIDQTAMYRYFNPNLRTSRLPAGEGGRRFLHLFADFLVLPETERAALLLVWQIQRRQRRKNGADKIDLADI
jgi:hypothetical protein